MGEGSSAEGVAVKVWESRQCAICRSHTGAITRYRFFPNGKPQFSAYAHGRCLEDLRKDSGVMDKLQRLLEQAAEIQMGETVKGKTGAVPEGAVRECGHCFHPWHGEALCEHDRTITVEGIAIDGPCGCRGEEVGHAR
jgi:hypothetical protein